jgi:hypothetical protein
MFAMWEVRKSKEGYSTMSEISDIIKKAWEEHKSEKGVCNETRIPKEKCEYCDFCRKIFGDDLK